MNAYSGPLAQQSWPEALAAEWVGRLDRVDPDGVVEGWCWRPDAPHARASVVIQLDGVPVASARCDGMRPDLAAAGFGDGAYGFLIVLSDAAGRAGGHSAVTLHDAETGRLLDRPRLLSRERGSPASAAAPALPLVEGNLDGVSAEGIVTGWCWHPLQPGHASVCVKVDGHVIGTTRADLQRPDLLKAGIGDGAHGFTFALPSSLLDACGILTIAVADAATGLGFGVPCIANPGKLSATHELVADLEHEIRRLQANFAALSAQIAHREATAPTHDLLATLAFVFADLAAEHARRSAGDAIRTRDGDAGSRPEPAVACVLSISAEPRATMIVPATADLDCLAACLASLHDSKLDEQAEIIVLAPQNAYADIALLHGMIGNLNLVENRSDSFADAILNLGRPQLPIVVLAPIVRPGTDWLDRLIATASHAPNAGIIGGRVIGEHDGLLRSAALDADPQDMPVPSGAFDLADQFPMRHLRCAEAVQGLGFLVTESGIAALRLHPRESHPSPSAGDDALDLCLRIRQAGLDVMVQPQANAVCADDADLDPYCPDLHQSSLLRAAWTTRPALRRSLAKALLIVGSVPLAGDSVLLRRIAALRTSRFEIVMACTGPASMHDAAAQWLEAFGIAMLDQSGGGSIGAYLAAIAGDIDVIDFVSENPPQGLLQRVRTLAPRAVIIGMETSQRWSPLSADERVVLNFIAKVEERKADRGDREGIAIIGDFSEIRCQNTWRWLVAEILPALAMIKPALPVLIVATNDSRPIAAQALDAGCPYVEICGVDDATLQRLCAMRLAVVPILHQAEAKGADENIPQDVTAQRPVLVSPDAMRLAAGLPTVSAISVEIFEGQSNASQHLVSMITATYADPTVSLSRSAAAFEQCRTQLLPAVVVQLYCDLVHCGNLGANITPPF